MFKRYSKERVEKSARVKKILLFWIQYKEWTKNLIETKGNHVNGVTVYTATCERGNTLSVSMHHTIEHSWTVYSFKCGGGLFRNVPNILTEFDSREVNAAWDKKVSSLEKDERELSLRDFIFNF